MIAISVNGRKIPQADVQVSRPERVAERVQWATYKYRVLGVWPGGAREEREGRDE